MKSTKETEDDTSLLEFYGQEDLKSQICYKLSCFDQAEAVCEKCYLTFCSSHISVYWSQNFLQHAFVGQKRRFISKNLCSKCERDNRLIGVFLAFFLLFPFLFTPLLILFG
ncbi:MAG: hypothetical protein ACW981_01665 [Candidatus Hodarchaeales archaeon]